MTQTRVYLPLTGADVRALRTAGRLASPIRAHAVTPALEREHPPSSLEEELEYDALCDAAAVASELAPTGTRRVIAAADVESVRVAAPARGDEGVSSAVEVTGVVELGRIASFHVDERPGGNDEDLLWYDVTELDEVIRLLG